MYALREQTRERRGEQSRAAPQCQHTALSDTRPAGGRRGPALPCLSLHLPPLPAERERPFAGSPPGPERSGGSRPPPGPPAAPTPAWAAGRRDRPPARRLKPLTARPARRGDVPLTSQGPQRLLWGGLRRGMTRASARPASGLAEAGRGAARRPSSEVMVAGTRPSLRSNLDGGKAGRQAGGAARGVAGGRGSRRRRWGEAGSRCGSAGSGSANRGRRRLGGWAPAGFVFRGQPFPLRACPNITFLAVTVRMRSNSLVLINFVSKGIQMLLKSYLLPIPLFYLKSPVQMPLLESPCYVFQVIFYTR